MFISLNIFLKEIEKANTLRLIVSNESSPNMLFNVDSTRVYLRMSEENQLAIYNENFIFHIDPPVKVHKSGNIYSWFKGEMIITLVLN